MLVYLVLFFLVSISYFFNQIFEKIKVWYYLIVSVFVLIAGFRDMIGGFDVYIYAEIYETISIKSLYFSFFEKGFTLYYYLLSYINEKREFMFFITSLLVLGLHLKQIRKYSPLLYLSVFIYFAKFYLMSFVYLRQGLALAIIWLAIPYLSNKKRIHFFAIVILAFFFHRSSLIILPFVFFANRQLKNIHIFLLAIAIFLVSISPLGSVLVSSLAENVGSTKLLVYSTKTGGINYFYLLEGTVFLVLAFIFRPYFYKSKSTIFIFNGFLLYTFIILFSLTNATFVRLAWYYFFFVIIALPYMYIYARTNFNRLTFKSFIYIYYSLVFFRLLLVYDGGDFMPYKTVFQDFDRDGRWEYMEYRNQ